MKNNIYIAGSLFTDKQINQRVLEENKLEEIFPDAYIYNPITNDEINDKTKKPTSRDIFLQDTKKVLQSNIITADLDDNDMGVAMELGIAYGVNYIINFLENKIANCIENKESDKVDKLSLALLEIKSQMPYKTVYATSSDIRQDTKDEEGRYKSWGQNQYVVGGIEEIGKIYRHFDEIIDELK